ncbi:hypothetical protein O6H91_04G065000 [Diphasiastrum complanatum]|uniref:Uncharacterized protein n=1 Tax=Diphasiastrum complanatum TaxID=34168 RepID=A0ACC2DXW2_DIPCM|nr:hypothetical protein O6H91_04G065000 [Diphasiastrum complanatum]
MRGIHLFRVSSNYLLGLQCIIIVILSDVFAIRFLISIWMWMLIDEPLADANASITSAAVRQLHFCSFCISASIKSGSSSISSSHEKEWRHFLEVILSFLVWRARWPSTSYMVLWCSRKPLGLKVSSSRYRPRGRIRQQRSLLRQVDEETRCGDFTAKVLQSAICIGSQICDRFISVTLEHQRIWS